MVTPVGYQRIQIYDMILQLNPIIPLTTPKGPGYAHFLIDYGPEHHLQWVTFIDSTGECWTFQNPEIKIQANITLGRTLSTLKSDRRVEHENTQRGYS